MSSRRTVELFSGTGSFSRVALERGYPVQTFDNDPAADELLPGTHKSLDLLTERPPIVFRPYILWASPPCQAFSVAAMGRNWDKETREPTTPRAREGMALLARTIDIIKDTCPRYWFIENPRGMMRKKIDALLGDLQYKRETVTYCQYGDIRMKPTDIWTNCFEWAPRPMCKNGMPCHEAAPRGARTGTQGVKGARDRSRIPAQLFEEILSCV